MLHDMKRITPHLIGFLLIVLCINQNLSAQDDSTFITAVDYINVKSESEFLALEKTIYRPMHENSVKKGEKVAWLLYQIIYPYGEDTRYNYASVSIYNNAANAIGGGRLNMHQLFKEVHPFKDINEKTENCRDVISGQVFELIDEALPGPSYPPSEYLSINHMVVSPRKETAYIDMETEVFKPVHEQRIKEGNGKDWMLFRLMYPYGAEFGYSYLTVDAHGSLEQMVTPNTEDTWKAAHANIGSEEAIAKISELRTLKRQETWRLVTYVMNTPE